LASIHYITLDVADVPAAEKFYASAFGLGNLVRVRASDDPSTGFRGFTISLIVGQPSTVVSLIEDAVLAGATILKAPEKSMWGFGGVVQAPDGAIWKVATSAKKETAPATKQVDQIVVLLAATDSSTSKRFFSERGFAVGKSFGKYVEFAMPTSPIGFGLFASRALAKDAGVPPEGQGSHRIALGSDAGPFLDPDGFVWESSAL